MGGLDVRLRHREEVLMLQPASGGTSVPLFYIGASWMPLWTVASQALFDNPKWKRRRGSSVKLKEIEVDINRIHIFADSRHKCHKATILSHLMQVDPLSRFAQFLSVTYHSQTHGRYCMVAHWLMSCMLSFTSLSSIRHSATL